MNDSNFWRAHEAYYRLPDDDDCDECKKCEGSKTMPNPDYDKDACEDEMESELTECDECEGSGREKKQSREDYLAEKADHDYQAYKDRDHDEKF